MAPGIRIKGAQQLMAKLESLDRLNAIKPAIKAATLHIKGKIAVYPPASIANSPSNDLGRWYQRGYGPRWKRKDGTTGGSKTSETLGRRWTTDYRNGGLTGVVGNNASYGPYVQQKEKQADFHRARGWLTDEDVIENERHTVERYILNAIDKALSK